MSRTVVRRIGSPLGQRLPSEPIIVKKRFLTPLLFVSWLATRIKIVVYVPPRVVPAHSFTDVGDHRFLLFDGQRARLQQRPQAFVCRRLDHHIGAVVDGEVTVRLDCLSLLWG